MVADLVRLQLLGPVEVVRGGRAVWGPGGRLATVLAVLAVRANETVTIDRLVDEIWSGPPPRSARIRIHELVSVVRRVLEGTAAAVVTHRAGYVLRIAPSSVDVTEFRRHVDLARTAEADGRHRDAARMFRAGLALWRGPALDGAATATLLREANALEQERLAAEEGHARNVLAADDVPADLGDRLLRLAGDHPLRETVHAFAMTALHRTGRQAEALAVFDGIRRRLRHELGVDPSKELRDAHHRVLVADPAARQAGRVVPAQLPADVIDFTGRRAEIRYLRELLAGPLDGPAVAAVHGMSGVGATTLAVYVAHQVAERFPDGQLYAVLGSCRSPRAPVDVLSGMLAGLGVAAANQPGGLAERAALFRSSVAGRRLLIVLDGAHDAAQVRPLLPGTPGCAVLVTGRRRLVNIPGARHVDLGVLDDADSYELLARIVGAARAEAEPLATADVLDACAGLPLAVRIAGAWLLARPQWPIAALAARLADDRLDVLRAGDLALRTAFDAAIPGDAELERAFLLLGTLPRPLVDLATAATALGVAERAAEALLDRLVDVNLVESAAPGHYRWHALLHAYARERGAGSGAALVVPWSRSQYAPVCTMSPLAPPVA